MTPAPVVISEVERLLYLKSLPLPRLDSRTLGRMAAHMSERTYGKGVVQSTQQITQLIDGLTLGLRLTTEYYFTPLGRNFESRGAGTPINYVIRSEL